MKAEVVDAYQAELGEGPVWDTANHRLIWVDILRGSVLATNPSGSTSTLLQFDDVVACVAPRDACTWLVATRESVLAVADWDDQKLLCTLPALPNVRANDGKMDPAGRFVVGTMHEDGTGTHGSLYSVCQNGSVQQLFDGVGISNGLAWNNAGDTMYYIDTPRCSVDAFDYEVSTGSATNRRPHVNFDTLWGSPDGMTIDGEGGIWVACWGGSAVRRFDDSGALSDVVEVDALNPTSCAFDDSNRLYITSASIDSPRSATDGALWAIDL